MKANQTKLIALLCTLISIVILTVPVFAVSGFKMPAYEKIILNNGLTIYLLEHHEVPLIHVQFVTMTGSIDDGEKYGLASLTAEALQFGTKSYTKNQIEETIDYYGASLNSFAGRDASYINSSFAAKDAEKIFPILNEIITKPVFDEAEFIKRKERLLVELDQARESPRSVIRSYFNQFLFGPEGYGIPVGGIKSSVGSIASENIKDFYKNNYTPQSSAIAIAGDFDTEKMREQVGFLFSSWKSTGKKNIPAESVPVDGTNKNRVMLVNKEDARETTFLIGTPGFKRANEDYLQIQVVNTILGGRFTSWLNDELRVNSGLTYGVRSSFSAYKTSGVFAISSFTGTETTIEAIDLALEVLNRLHKEGIDEETLLSAKNYINGQFPPKYETAGDLAGLLTDMYIYGYSDEFINTFQSKVDQMTTDDAKRIIAKYFPKENLQFVLIGKSSDIKNKVVKYGAFTEKEIKADGF